VFKKKPNAKLLTKPIDKQGRIAFICSFCLGDSLIALVTVNNFLRNGYQVDVYGDFVYALRDWFPQYNIKPLIKVADQEQLESYTTVLHMYESELSRQIAPWHANSIALSHSPLYLARMSMTDIQVALCREEFGLSDLVRVNGMQPPTGLQQYKFPKRIVLHPTSSLVRKNWPAKKFLKLAQILKERGFDPVFIIAPNERSQCLEITASNFSVPSFANLSAIAAYFYESGYFIGNDSGLGHLASNLGIPTVSIILRPSVARQWRPTWALGEVALSPTWLNPRPIKEKLWKYCTSVARVLSYFDRLLVKCQKGNKE
jgi:heptosyltransferase III